MGGCKNLWDDILCLSQIFSLFKFSVQLPLYFNYFLRNGDIEKISNNIDKGVCKSPVYLGIRVSSILYFNKAKYVYYEH